jgi:hypothetical protein
VFPILFPLYLEGNDTCQRVFVEANLILSDAKKFQKNWPTKICG